MISKYIIRALYKKYSKPPRNFSELNIDEFVSICGDSYGITVDDVSMTFGQMSEDNPFRTILLRNIYGIVPVREPDRCKMCSSVIGTVFIPLKLKLCRISRTCRLQQSPVIGIVKFREMVCQENLERTGCTEAILNSFLTK